jgi:DNA (cytosine-5)-methyltransferase 1
LANEILESPVQTYEQNFNVERLSLTPTDQELPGITHGDVSHLSFSGVEKTRVQLVVGGPPCQDFSIVRGPISERQGIKVKRGRLYNHFIRGVVKFNPSIFVMENVPGLMSANDRSAWTTILTDFQDVEKTWNEIKTEEYIKENGIENQIIGYNIVHKEVVNMANIGVPQKRRRVILVGLRKDINHGRADSFEKVLQTEFHNKTTSFSKYPLTPLEVFEGKPLSELQNEYEKIMNEYDGIWEENTTPEMKKWKEKIWDNLEFEITADYFFINNIVGKEDDLFHLYDMHRTLLSELGYYGKNVKTLESKDNSNILPNESESTKNRMRMIPPDKNHSIVNGTEWHVNGRGMSLIYRRLHPLKPATTVVAYGGGGTWTYHYERERSAITNRERARLQTFPDTHLFAGNRSHVRAQIGEAVPPLFAKRLGNILVNYIVP